MTIRYYLLPVERSTDGNGRGPKYFTWRRDPDPPGISVAWNMLDYGLIDQAIVVANVTTAQHNSLAAHADVLAIPTNLNSTLNAAAVTAAQNYLEGIGAPGDWVTTGLTYRQVLRVVGGCFLFLQRVTGILGRAVTLNDGTLDVQVQNIPADIRAALAQAATELGYDYSAVTGTTTVRQILKAMAQAWGTQPIYMGIATL